jgi:hypothetical protein
MKFGLAALLISGLIAGANAQVPYMPGSGWREFTFAWPLADPSVNREGEFIFTVYPGQQAFLTVIDVGFPNEKFEIFDSRRYLGTTSNPNTSWPPAFRNLTNPSPSSPWSYGMLPLLPGTYALSFRLTQSSTIFRDVFYDPPDIIVGTFQIEISQTDEDHDGLGDQFETGTGTGIYVSPVDTGTDPGKSDSDGDGLKDWAEIATHGTNPNLADTDGDGFSDREEVHAASSPTDPAEKPNPSFEIVLERSEDMATWTPFATQTVPASRTANFFRARITHIGAATAPISP